MCTPIESRPNVNAIVYIHPPTIESHNHKHPYSPIPTHSYVSLSAVHRTVPFRNHATVSDTRIIEHYRARHGPAWDGSYVIWVVPPDVEGHPAQVVEEDGAYVCVRVSLCVFFLFWGW